MAGRAHASRTWSADVAIVARREPTDSARRDASLATATALEPSTISATSRPAAASVVPTPTVEPVASASPASGTSRIASAASATDTRITVTRRPGPASVVEISPLGTIATVASTISTEIHGLAWIYLAERVLARVSIVLEEIVH